MPYKNPLCGIYSIAAPDGSVYVGCSNNINNRWSDHKSRLRHGKHRSAKLQAVWDKYGNELKLKIIELCDKQNLESREQYFIEHLNATLNTGGWWKNPEAKAKMAAVHASDEWRKLRRDIAKKTALQRGVCVDCSDGRSFANFHRAAEAFGVRPSGIKILVETQRIGKLGVRFKKANEPWRDVVSWQEQRAITMKQNGNDKRSAESRLKMSLSAKARIRTSKAA